MTTPQQWKSSHVPSWCPGCGNYGLLNSLLQAMSKADLAPESTVVVSGIGCSGKDPHFLSAYGFEVLHGRVLPVATGIKLANHALKVIGCSGDGDAYGIGGNHFLHACRRNIGITYFVHDNQVYGLTTGQTSPTSLKGFMTKSTPSGVIEQPVNPIALSIVCGATFVARTFVGAFDHIKAVMTRALQHKGFAVVDILQPCVTFNSVNTYEWFQKRVYALEEVPGYDFRDKQAALAKAMLQEDRVPIGVFYQESRPAYEDEVLSLRAGPLVGQDVSAVDIAPLLKEFL